MIHDTLPPNISNETYQELLTVEGLARRVFQARSNFTKLCAALEELYGHFDLVEGKKAA